MTATATRSAVLCDCCDAPLTGGRDTYGGVGQTLCFTCFHTDPRERCETVTQAEAKTEKRREFLETLKQKLEEQHRRIESDRDYLMQTMNKLDCRIADIEGELRGASTCDESEEDDQ